jgi:hypothetical protein
MKHYNDNEIPKLYERHAAAEDDVLSLIWLIKGDIK